MNNDSCNVQSCPTKKHSKFYYQCLRIAWAIEKNYNEFLCWLKGCKWDTYEGGIKWSLDEKYEYQMGHVICRRCHKHLCNYVTNIKLKEKNEK